MKHPFVNDETLKRNSVVHIPQYKAADYMLVLSPHEELWKKIMTVKEAFAKKYNCPMAFGTKPHLTLLKFMQLEMAEERIVNRLRMIAMAQPCIKVELKDFGSFPSHTIHINVTSKVPLMNLSKALKEAQPLLKFNPEFKPFFLTDPHLTIARKLLPWQYEKAWLEYSNTSFTGRFMANRMTLIKRRIGNQSYSHVQHFDFENLPVVTTQGSLFM